MDLDSTLDQTGLDRTGVEHLAQFFAPLNTIGTSGNETEANLDEQEAVKRYRGRIHSCTDDIDIFCARPRTRTTQSSASD